MSISHILGTVVFILNVFFTNGQTQFRQNMFAPGRQFQMPGRQFQGFNQNAIPGMQGFRPGFPPGINVPPPAGFQRVTGQLRNQLPTGIQNALPRNIQNALPGQAQNFGTNQRGRQNPGQTQRQNVPQLDPRLVRDALNRDPFAATQGVNRILNGGAPGFANRFGLASGQELTRQLSPSARVFGGFNGADEARREAGAANRIQRPQTQLNMPFGQQNLPNAVPMRQQPTRQNRPGPRNQPQDVMPRRVGALDLSSIQPGQRFANQAARTMTFPTQTNQVQPRPINQFNMQNRFQPPVQQQMPTNQLNMPQAFIPPVQQAPQPTVFGAQQINPTQRTFQQAAGGASFLNTAPQQPRAVQSAGQQFGGRQTSLAFPQRPITQPLGVGRPGASVQVPPGAPPMLPGELEIAPPISPDAAAAMQGTPGSGPPGAMSEIVTISDINGNILYRGVDLSDKDIEKITQQLVNNMTDAQATDAAKKGQELAAQGTLETAGGNAALRGGQTQAQPSIAQPVQPAASQPAQQSAGGFPGQGFTSWGQQSQGLRFPGQDSVVGESRTVVNLVDRTA